MYMLLLYVRYFFFPIKIKQKINMAITVLLPKDIPDMTDRFGLRNISILMLTCGEKYYIAKTANPSWMIDEIKATYGRYLRDGIHETNLFYPLIRYMHKENNHTLKVEVLFTSTNGYQVLKFELEQLAQHFGNKNCLNKNNVPHIPKTVRAKKGSNWLTVNEELNFRRLLKKYEY